MVLCILILLTVAFSGLVLTYLFAEDETFLWRMAAGNIVGSTIFGLVGLLVCCAFGLTTATASVSLLIALAPLSLLSKKDLRGRLTKDWERAKANLNGADFRKLVSFAYYAAFFLLFIFFFDRAMFQTSAGILTGGSQNLGDLPFHLGAIFSFTEGANFPPQNPSYAGTTFSYPFIADLLTALTMKFGIGVETAMCAENVSWAFSLLVMLEKLTAKMTGSRLAGKIAPALLFFSGGLGFVLLYKEFGLQSKSFFDFLFNLPSDYTIRQATLRWGNSLCILFLTQRSLLLGMPLTLLILNGLWKIFSRENNSLDNSAHSDESARLGEAKSFSTFHFPFSIFLLGLLAGTLPLVHLHSLIVLFVVTGFLLVLKPESWREWIIFGIGVGVIAVPEIAWSIHNSASRTGEFFGWHFGWDKGDDENFFIFWLKNTGIFVPLMLAGMLLRGLRDERRGMRDEKSGEEKRKTEKVTVNLKSTTDSKPEIISPSANDSSAHRSPLTAHHSPLLFYLPFLFCFVCANVYRFAPWQWDNIKILIYWFAASIPFAAFALAWAWRKNIVWKIAASGCLIILCLAGALDVWRAVSRQVNITVFDADSVKIAGQIIQKTEPHAVFLNAATYNSPIVLTGRPSLMRYRGHLFSYGIDFQPRLDDVQRIYQGDAAADLLLKKYDIGYVLISPEERSAMAANEQYFSKFPVIAESGQYRLYKVK